MSERTNVWKCLAARMASDQIIFVGYAEPVDLLSIVARGTLVLWVGYSYEDVIGPADSFRVTHLTCDMIQKRRVVVTSSIGFPVRAISVPRPTRIASPPSSSSITAAFLAFCSLFITSKLARRLPLFLSAARSSNFVSRHIRLMYTHEWALLPKFRTLISSAHRV